VAYFSTVVSGLGLDRLQQLPTICVLIVMEGA
jgi:hypothetical protein